MSRWTLLFLFCTFLTPACTEDDEREWVVNYQVRTVSGSVTYRVTYIDQFGAERSEGPISRRLWVSENLDEFEDGSRVSLKVETLSGRGIQELEILRQSAVHETGTKGADEAEFTISDQL